MPRSSFIGGSITDRNEHRRISLQQSPFVVCKEKLTLDEIFHLTKDPRLKLHGSSAGFALSCLDSCSGVTGQSGGEW